MPLDSGLWMHHAGRNPPHVHEEPSRAAKPIGFDVIGQGKDAFGRLTHAFITFRGFWMKMSTWKSRHPVQIEMSLGKKGPWSMACTFDTPLNHLDRPLADETLVNQVSSIFEDLYLLHISKMQSRHKLIEIIYHHLILKPTTNKGEFRRVGIAYIEVDEFSAAGNWEEKKVTIV
jgi:hypothetical protein